MNKNKLIDTKEVQKVTSKIEEINLKKDEVNNSKVEVEYKIVECNPEYLLLSELIQF